MDLSFIYPPRNRESVLGRKQGLVAKVSNKRKIQKINKHKVIETIARATLNL
jgi:hypothetical protein